jgi:NADH-quinone oxidoreductase subunit L
MRQMGGLRKYMPWTFWTMLLGTAAIAGVPFLSGFYSKEEILGNVYYSHDVPRLIYFIGLVTALMTAFYMTRLMRMTFFGELRNHHVHPHESPWSMVGVLVVLAIGSVAAGWPAHSFEHWLEPAFPHREAHHGDAATHYALLGAALTAAAIGIFVGTRLELKGAWTKVLQNKWYVDEIYDFLFVNGLSKGGGSFLARFDQKVVDGGVNGTAWLTRFNGRALGIGDFWIVDGAVRLIGFITKAFSYPVRALQTGYVQTYAFFVLAGLLVIFGFYVTR